MKVTISERIKAEVKELLAEQHRDGSRNFEVAVACGMVSGSPKYAGSEPHHACHGSAWIYEEMHHALTEAALTELFEGSESVRIEECWLRWSEAEGTRLLVQRNGVIEERKVADELVIEFNAQIQNGDDWDDMNGTIGRAPKDGPESAKPSSTTSKR